jgi:C4-dicarboxylate-specific signal transduction histidine kinase
VDISLAIDSALLLLRNRLEEPDQILRPHAPEPWQARCDPNRFEQVLVNLLANALDELQDRPDGCIEISGHRTTNNWYCKSAIMAPACRTPYAHSCSSPLSPPSPPASAWDWG